MRHNYWLESLPKRGVREVLTAVQQAEELSGGKEFSKFGQGQAETTPFVGGIDRSFSQSYPEAIHSY